MNKSYSLLIEVIINGTTNIFVPGWLQPILNSYEQLVDDVQKISSSIKEDTDKVDLLNAYLEACQQFDYENIKAHINQKIEETANGLVDQNFSWFQGHYSKIYAQLMQESFPTSDILKVKNQFYAAFNPLYSILSEMERAHRSIQSKLQVFNDSSRGVKAGWSGGMIGGAIGSMILPGIGSVIGGFIGGSMMGDSQDDKIIESIYVDIETYLKGADKVHAYFVNNMKIICSCWNDVTKAQINFERAMYLKLKDQFPEINDAFYGYYQNVVEEIEQTFAYVPEGGNKTVGEYVEEFFGYIKDCQQAKLGAA